MCRTACTEPQCLYNGVLHLHLYLYSPYGMYSLYKGALYLYLYLYSPYGPFSLYKASVPVQRCTLPLPITLLALCAVQPVQSLSECTMVYFTFTYTSTPPMDRTACTEPQCLYNGAVHLYLYLYSPNGMYSLYKGALYLYLYLYSHYGPYSLYRASVPVQRCTLPLSIPLLPL